MSKVTIVEQPREVISVESFINKAIESNVPVETMERLFNLRKEVKKEFAKEAFDKAMSEFQGKCPIIQKKKEGGRTQGGTVAYKYAPIEYIVSQVEKLLTENGFSYSFKTPDVEGEKVKVICIAKHNMGHSEESEITLPFGTKTGVMSAPQVHVATVSFAKRYTFCNVFGIIVGDEDKETNLAKDKTSTTPKKSTNIKSQIMFLLTTLKVDVTKKENIGKEIKKMTKLDVDDEKNLEEIKNRLEILVSENN